MSRTRRPSAVLAAVLLAASLSACGGGDDPAPEAAPVADATSAPTASSTPTEQASTAPATGSGEAVAVDQTITDDVLGHTVLVKSVVRGFPLPDRLTALKDRGTEVVLVELEATAGTEFSAVVGASTFRVVPDGGQEASSTTVVDQEMTAAGYAPLKDVRTGETGTGWVAFTVEPADAPLVLRYKRGAAGVLGSGETIEAQDVDVPLA